jgi:hypothetical protein
MAIVTDTNRWNGPKLLVPTGLILAFLAIAVPATGTGAFVLEPPGTTADQGGSSVDRHNGPPKIILVSPRSLKGVSSPFEIELRFLASPHSKILRDSIRVLYGFFEFDIADRLTRNAVVSLSGILAKNADLPSGSHSITIEVSDDRNRTARKTFEIDVKDE